MRSFYPTGQQLFVAFVFLIVSCLPGTVRAQGIVALPTCPNFTAGEWASQQEYSLYREYYRQGNFADALPHWRWIYRNAPTMSKNVYINGVVLYRDQIEQAISDQPRQALIDTLESIHLQRASCFDDKGVALGNLVYDIHRYCPDDWSWGWKYGREAVDMLDQDLPRHLILPVYRFGYLGWKEGFVSDQELRHLHARLSSVIRVNIAREYSPDIRGSWELTGHKLEEALPLSVMGSADLSSYFYRNSPEILTDSGRLARLEQRFRILDATGVSTYEEVLCARKDLHPDASLVSAWLEIQFVRHPDSLETFAQRELDRLSEVDRCLVMLFVSGKLRAQGLNGPAYGWAKEATEADPGNGMAYIVMGDIFLSSVAMLSIREKQQVSALAIQTYKRALSDPSSSELARQRIDQYTAHLPRPSDIFHYALAGEQFRFESDWMRGLTVEVRTRKP